MPQGCKRCILPVGPLVGRSRLVEGDVMNRSRTLAFGLAAFLVLLSASVFAQPPSTPQSTPPATPQTTPDQTTPQATPDQSAPQVVPPIATNDPKIAAQQASQTPPVAAN